MTVVRTECKRGHNLTTPRAFYIDQKGHRRCRRCHLEKMAAYAYKHRRRRQRPVTSLEPHLYRKWADRAWASMTDRDRALIAYALLASKSEAA